jgi:type VI secretion system secreted protein Hcp
MATHDHFLKLDGIDGESQDSKFKNQIDVLTYGFMANQGGTSHTGGGGGKGRVALGDIVISKNIDKASPALFQYCCSGQPITKAVLTSRKAGKDQQPYYVVTMTDVLVSSHQTGNTNGNSPAAPTASIGTRTGPSSATPALSDDWLATEQITLNYSTISIAYSEQAADGSVKGAITKGWDAKQNKVI